MTVTSLVVISSKYKTADSRSTTDFTYSIGQSLEISRVAIKTISIPNLQYNINTKNNVLRVYHGVTHNDITVPVGQYNITTLISSLESLIGIALSDTVTITQDNITNKLTINTTSVNIKISIDPELSPLSKLLGLGDKPSSTLPELSFVTSITAPFLPNLSGLKNFYLASRVLSQGYNGIFKNGSQVPLLMNVPITVDYGFVEHYDPQDIMLNMKTFNRPQNIQFIDIKILDEDLNVVDLNGGDVEIVLKIYTEKMFNKEK